MKNFFFWNARVAWRSARCWLSLSENQTLAAEQRHRDLGFAQSVFDAIRAGQTPSLDSERERVVYELAMISMEPGGGSDEVFARADKLLGRNGVAEVVALLGYYTSVAMGMKLHRVPVPVTS